MNVGNCEREIEWRSDVTYVFSILGYCQNIFNWDSSFSILCYADLRLPFSHSKYSRMSILFILIITDPFISNRERVDGGKALTSMVKKIFQFEEDYTMGFPLPEKLGNFLKM